MLKLRVSDPEGDFGDDGGVSLDENVGLLHSSNGRLWIVVRSDSINCCDSKQTPVCQS